MPERKSKSLRPTDHSSSAVDSFLERLAQVPVVKAAARRGRLIFAMDATASREPMWEQAAEIQGQMFTETAALGGLEIQLCFYRGPAEFKASQFLVEARDLLRHMRAVHCISGFTQLGRVLRHARTEHQKQPVDAIVFVGDCMEEPPEPLFRLAGELGLLRLPVFLFQEGNDALAKRAFSQIARLTGGAHCPFDARSPQQLRDLLSAVAVYAAGGRKALEQFTNGRSEAVALLAKQVGGTR